ncbi:MAG: hypothetical protein AB7L41_04345 [Flavobacteriaceae bacterium]
MGSRHAVGPASVFLAALRGLAGLAAGALACGPAAAEVIERNGYSFSDELGDFRLISVEGEGTRDAPFVITEEMTGIAPATLVIRRTRVAAYGDTAELAYGLWTSLAVEIRLANASGRSWSGFELELQEKRDQPSVYGDGLSFDQGHKVPEGIGSDLFRRFERMTEPYDRIQFTGGDVDDGETVRFSAYITDPTPTPVFYLLQDPKLHFAALGITAVE